MSQQILTTIVTPSPAVPPGAAYDLVDIRVVKDELAIVKDATQDGFLLRAINQASTQIAQYCNRTLHSEKVQDVIYPQMDPYPYQAPFTFNPLQLSRWPIISVDSVVVNDPTIGPQTEGTDFIVSKPEGQLLRISAITNLPVPWIAAPVTVIYTAGYSPIPADLVDATLRLITLRYKGRGRDPMLRQIEQPGLGIETYWVGGPPKSGNLPLEIAGICDNYRVPVVGR